MRRSRGRRDGERGQILVLFSLVIVLIMGLAAMVVDVGVLRSANQNLWNALDSGALAGASQLPDDGAAADTLANQYLQKNYPDGLPAGNTSVSFRCLVGSSGGSPRLSDVPAVCDPGAIPAPVWTCNSSICVAMCVPASGDKCNTVVLTGVVSVPYGFGNAIGVSSGSTEVLTSAACRGPCGAPPDVPLDMILVIDRSSSMSGVDTTNARAASNSIRPIFDPNVQWMGISLLGPSTTGQSCQGAPSSSIGTANPPTDLTRWVPVDLSGIGAPNNEDYRQSGSDVAKIINCYPNSSTGTDLADPITMAAWDLTHHGRSGVKKGIILMTDGQPNASTNPTSNYCAQANSAATAVKAAGIEVFTVAFGLDGSNDIDCPDTSGSWNGKTARTLVASMATASVDGGCPGTSNDDGDHFYCVPKTAGASADLSNAFKSAAVSLAGGTKLVKLP